MRRGAKLKGEQKIPFLSLVFLLALFVPRGQPFERL